MNEDDRRARKQFSDILFTVLNPSGVADSMAETTAWLKDERPLPVLWFLRPRQEQRQQS